MKFIKPILILWLTLLPATIFGSPNDYLGHSHWDSGKAEFQVYQGNIAKYGIERSALVKIIVVKEPFHREKQVKTLSADDADDVLKMNYIQVIPAGVYDYYQTASFFFHRKTGKMLKYTMSSQDGCGSTFMVYRYRDQKNLFQFHSYFDDQGDVTEEIDEDPIYFYDALPLLLRFWINKPAPYKIRLVGSLLANRKNSLTVHSADVSSRQLDGVKINGTTHPSVVAVSVTFADQTDLFYFEKKFPNTLIKWVKSSGDELTLHKDHFLYYWNYTRPGHEGLVE